MASLEATRANPNIKKRKLSRIEGNDLLQAEERIPAATREHLCYQNLFEKEMEDPRIQLRLHIPKELLPRISDYERARPSKESPPGPFKWSFSQSTVNVY